MVIVKFEGVDNWQRPIFKDVHSEARYGSFDTLFNKSAREGEVLQQVFYDDLQYFGNSFGCEPVGTPAAVKIVGKDIDPKTLVRAEKTFAWIVEKGRILLNMRPDCALDYCLCEYVIMATRLRIYAHISAVVDVLKMWIPSIEKLKNIIGDAKNVEKN